MTVYDFAGLTNGDPWPAAWTTDTTYSGGGTVTMNVQGERGRIQASVSGFAPERGHAYMSVAHADVDVAFAFSFPSNATYQITTFGLRVTTVPPETMALPATGYFLKLQTSATSGGDDTMTLVRRNTDVETDSGLTLAGKTITDGDSWIARMQVITTDASTVTIKVKVWKETDDEPDWQMTWVDTAAGRLTSAGRFTITHGADTASTGISNFDLRVADVVDAGTFDYSAPVLTATLDDSDYSVDLSWTGSASDTYEIERETWAGDGEPWL